MEPNTYLRAEMEKEYKGYWTLKSKTKISVVIFKNSYIAVHDT